MIRAEFDKSDIRRAMKNLGEVDKRLLSTLRKEIRSELKNVVSMIQQEVPTTLTPGLSNLNKPSGLGGGWYPQKSYGPVKVSTSVTPGINRTFSGVSQLTSIKVQQIDKNAGFKITENAGTKSSGRTPQGRAFIRNLNDIERMRGRGGRWAFRSYIRHVKSVKAAGERIVGRFANLLDREGF